MKKFLALALSVILSLGLVNLAYAQGFPGASGNPSPISRPGGFFYAPAFFWQGSLVSGNTTTGASQSIIMVGSTGGMGGLQMPGGTTVPLQVVFNTLTPIIVDFGQGNQETVTPTSTSVGTCPAGNIGVGGVLQCVTIVGTFNNTHGQSAVVIDGSFGAQTALNYAASLGGGSQASGTAKLGGGGTVTIDSAWFQMGGTDAILTALVPYSNISIMDMRSGIPRLWNGTPTGAALAVPTTLTSQAACDATHQFCSDANVASTFTSGTIFGAVSLVDCFGNEGPPSLTASFTSVVSKAIDIASPAASAGACGWIPYLSLVGGTYAQAYAIPPTAAICTLSTLTPIPSCAILNTNYSQSTSIFAKNSVGQVFNGGAQITAPALNTGQHFCQLGSTIMTTVSLTPICNSAVTYSYAPSNRVGACAISSANVSNYAAAPSTTTAIPNGIATWTIPAGCFNFIGAEFRVSGKFTFTDGGDTTSEIRVAWDAPLSNATTVPTTLCSMIVVATGAAAAQNGTYSCVVRTNTTGVTGKALVNGWSDIALAAGQTTLVRSALDVAVAPSAATVNWTVPARVVVYFIGTGATNNPGAQGLAATLEVAN
jgi:hypothetical protein